MSTGDEIGYAKPPRNTRFRKGRSGNPKGRPPGRKKEPPYEAVLGQMVTVREDGIERRVTAAEAFALYLTKQGLDGDNAAARQAAEAIGDARAKRREFSPQGRRTLVIKFVQSLLTQLRNCRHRPRATAHGQETQSISQHRPDAARALDRRDGA